MEKPAVAAPATVPNHWERGDPVADALHFLRMSGVVYCWSELTAPWGFHMPPMDDCLMFHVVTSGRCHLVDRQGGTHLLQSGDFALVPRGDGHDIASRIGLPTPSLFELPRTMLSDWFEVLQHGGGGEPATLVCGAVRFDDPAVRLLLSALPGVIVLAKADTPELAWFDSTVRFLAEEARGRRPGCETVITRLADILVIQALRAWIDRDRSARTGWLGALRDRHIGRAIVMIHRDPAQPWTIESLAQAVGLSRSAFAARFSQMVGQPVLEYLTQWRIGLATTRLRQGGSSVSQIAYDVGYGSEAAFSRAFKRVTGTTPGSVQRS